MWQVWISPPRFLLENNVKVGLDVTNNSILLNLIGKYHGSESGVYFFSLLVIKL